MSITSKRAAEVLSMAVTFNGCGRSNSDEMKEAVCAGIAALREKAKREDPCPLSLEELREMDDVPFYVMVYDPERVIIFPAISDNFKDEDVAIWCGDEQSFLNFKDYGKTWIAYRHKPKEAQE